MICIWKKSPVVKKSIVCFSCFFRFFKQCTFLKNWHIMVIFSRFLVLLTITIYIFTHKNEVFYFLCFCFVSLVLEIKNKKREVKNLSFSIGLFRPKSSFPMCYFFNICVALFNCQSLFF